MPAYDLDYDPPAPVAGVVLAHAVTGAKSALLRGKLDTGAGLTVIPQSMVVQLGLTTHRFVWARSYDGSYCERAVYYVRLAMEGHECLAVRCVAVERTTVLVGRNVLNRFVLALDGGKLRFELKPVSR